METFLSLVFGIAPSKAEQMDPQQRLLMMYVWKAIEDAGYSAESLSGTNTALFVGTASSGYGERAFRAHMGIEGYSATAQAPSMGPNRMSYFLNLHGPSEAIDTACSSSLVAIHRGVSTIESGECSMAIVGGVNALISPEAHISFSRAGMLSPDGRCKTFSAAANGYVRGEGVGMLVLKSLAQAEQDGDHIYGVIVGSAENHGGRASSLTAPNPRAQADVLIAAYRKAGIDPRTVGYIEAHGTGTALGDPIEINGLKTAFSELAQIIGEGPMPQVSCGIGSVKSNIGHLELASGVAGVIKVVLQMEDKTLVKSLHCEQINPYIQLESSPFYIVQENSTWEALRDTTGNPLPRRAGVSSFGVGGANAHVVLEEYVPKPRAKLSVGSPQRPACIVLSARDKERLDEQVQHLLAWIAVNIGKRTGVVETGQASVHVPTTPFQCAIEDSAQQIEDLAYTLQVGREAMEERLAFQVNSFAELEEKLHRYLQRPQETGNWYRGQVKQHKEAVALLHADEGLRETIDRWFQYGKYEILLQWWVKGLKIEWQRLYTIGAEAGQDPIPTVPPLPRRISLPTYPFARERYWISTETSSEAEPQAISMGRSTGSLTAIPQAATSFHTLYPFNPSFQSPSRNDIGSCNLPTGGVYTPNPNKSSGNALVQQNTSTLFESQRTKLLTPGWKEEALSGESLLEEAFLPTKLLKPGASQLVLLCDLPGIEASRIQAKLPQCGRCRSLQSLQPHREQRFQDMMVQLIQELQSLRQSRPVEAVLVQVVVAHRAEPSLLEALVGVLKVVQQEHPTLQGQLIEVIGEPDEGELLVWLRENQRILPHEPHIRYQDGKRWVREWQELDHIPVGDGGSVE